LVGSIVPLLFLLVLVVVVSAQALGVLIFEEEQPLTAMRIDVINVTCSHISTFSCALPTQRFLGEPVSSDRLPNW